MPDNLDEVRDPQQGGGKVRDITSRRRKAGEFDPESSFDHRVFEGLTRVVEWMPPNAPPGFPALQAEIKLNVISSEDLADYNRNLDDARFRAKRVSYLTDQLAQVADVGDLDDLETDPGSDEAMDLRDQIDDLKKRPDAMHININSIIIPTVIRWNMKIDGVLVPLDPVQIKTVVAVTAVNGLSKVIIQAVNGELQKLRPKSRR